MIDFRYHLVSIVAVFLALAIGIVLGSTELQGHTLEVLQSTSDSLRSQLNATSNERDSYQAQAAAAQKFLQAAEPALLSGRLSGQRAVIVAEPGAASGVVSGVRQAAETAGATVTGQVALQPKFNDISGATESSLGTINSSVAGDNGITLTGGSSSPQTAYQQQAAQLIAAAILEKSGSGGKHAMSTGNARTLLSAYGQGGYLTVSGSPTDRAALVIVVVPAAPPPGGQDDPANQVLQATLPEFASASSATVAVGGTAGSAASGSSIQVLRNGSVSDQVSTVDNADTALGQISAVQALAAQLAGGKPSSYGVSGASAVSPEPMPSPVSTATATVPPRGNQTGKAGR